MSYRRIHSIVSLVILTILAAASLAAAQDLAVIATSDFTSGSLASLRVGGDTASVNLINTHGDNAVRSYNGTVYVINRLNADNILVLDPKDLRRPVRQFSVGNGANPQDIAFASPTKAYVVRYDRASLLVVNPARGDSLKAVDLSAFADADGVPEMAAAFVVGKRVYVTCQRLDRKARFAPTDRSVIAVIDAEADTVVDLDARTAGVQGINLTLKNPGSAALRNDRIYLSCVGSYSDFKDGGIEVVDTAQNRSLGARISEEVLGGNVGPLAVASDSAGFVVVSDTSFVNSIRRFDLSAKTASAPLRGHSGGFTPDIQVFGGRLYVADQGSFTDPKSAGILIYDAATGEKLKGPISTGLPPNGIAFVAASSAGSGSEVLGPISLDLDLTPGDQGVRTKGGVSASQKVDVEVVAVEKAAGATGFSARIEFDSTQVSYVNGSFKAGTLFSGTFLPLATATASYVDVGGAVLGSGSATADRGSLGALQFEVKSGFKAETQLTLTAVAYNRGGGRSDRFELRTFVKLSAAGGGLASDFDGNGEVGFDDFFAFAGVFGKKRGEAGFEAKFDLSQNGEIDFEDFFIFAGEFGKKR